MAHTPSLNVTVTTLTSFSLMYYQYISLYWLRLFVVVYKCLQTVFFDREDEINKKNNIFNITF